MKDNIRLIYLYVVSLIALIILVINAGRLINLALKNWVFTQADQDYYYAMQPPLPKELNTDPELLAGISQNSELTEAQRQAIDSWLADYRRWQEQQPSQEDQRRAQQQREAASSIAYLLVAAPVFYYHWKLARVEREARKAETHIS